jgi:hypothetical protein
MTRWLLLALVLVPDTVLAYGGFQNWGVYLVKGTSGVWTTYDNTEYTGTMIVQPDGVVVPGDPHLENMRQLYVVTHSGHKGGPELLAAYDAWDPQIGHFILWKSNCSLRFPCPTYDGGSRTDSGVVLQVDMRDYPQYLVDIVDAGGHPNKGWIWKIKFVESGYVRPGELARWRQSTELFNWSAEPDGRWEEVQSHEFEEVKVSCTDPGQPTKCDVWMGVTEVWTDDTRCPAKYPEDPPERCVMPRIKEVGWEKLTLTHDRGTSLMIAPYTRFEAGSRFHPKHLVDQPHWRLVHRVGNHSYGVGTIFNPAATPRLPSH